MSSTTITCHQLSCTILLINLQRFKHYQRDDAEKLTSEQIVTANKFLTKQFRSVTSPHQPTLQQFIQSIPTNLNILQSTLQSTLESFHSPDDLFDFFHDDCAPLIVQYVGSDLQEGQGITLTVENEHGIQSTIQYGIDQSSVAGMWLREIVWKFKQRMWDGVGELFDELQNYLNPSDDSTTQRFVAAPELEQWIEQQTQKLQYSSSPSTSLTYILSSLPSSLPSTHSLKSSLALRNHDFQTAVESLYRYWDGCMNKKSQDTEPNDSTTTVQKVQQYALLNYSILNYHFGLFDECALSIQETIRIAQQNNDHVCLMHATGLLTKLALQKPASSSYLHLSSVQRCVMNQVSAAEKAKKALEESRRTADASNPTPTPAPIILPPVPTVDMESWQEMAKLQLMRRTESQQTITPPAFFTSLNNMLDLQSTYSINNGESLALRSAGWKEFGSRSLASLFSSVHLLSHSAHTPSSSLISSFATSCSSSVLTTDDYSTLISIGDQQWAEVKEWKMTRSVLEFDRAIQRGDISSASIACSTLNSLSPTTTFEFSFHIELLLMQSRLAWCEGAKDRSLEECFHILELCRSHHQFLCSLRPLLLFSSLFSSSAPSHLVRLLPHLLECWSSCLSSGFTSSTAMLSIVQSRIHRAQNSPEQALALLRTHYNHVIENETATIQIQMEKEIAAAIMQLAENNESKEASFALSCISLESALQIAVSNSCLSEAAELHYTLSRLYHQIEQQDKRDQHAQKFGEMQKTIVLCQT